MDEKDGAGKIISKRKPQGLLMSEALTRCPPADEDEREALVELFKAIEAGALMGAWRGIETVDEWMKEG